MFVKISFSQKINISKQVKYNDFNIYSLKGNNVKGNKKRVTLNYDDSDQLIRINIPITNSEFIFHQENELNEFFLYKTDILSGVYRNKNLYDSILVKGDSIYYQRKYFSKGKNSFLRGELKVLKINRARNNFEYMHFYIDSAFSFKNCVFFENENLKKMTELRMLKSGVFNCNLNGNVFIKGVSIFWHIADFFLKIDIDPQH